MPYFSPPASSSSARNACEDLSDAAVNVNKYPAAGHYLEGRLLLALCSLGACCTSSVRNPSNTPWPPVFAYCGCGFCGRCGSKFFNLSALHWLVDLLVKVAA